MIMYLLWEERNENPQEPINAHLRHGAGQDNRGSQRGFAIGIGQPGVKRHQRNLDGKSKEHAEKYDFCQRFRGKAIPAEFDREKRNQFAGSRFLGESDEIQGSARQKDGKEGEQHRHASHQSVNEELGSSARTLRTSPKSYEEVRWNEAEFPKNEPMEKIQCREGAIKSALEQQHQRKVNGGVLFNFARSQDADGNHNAGQ